MNPRLRVGALSLTAFALAGSALAAPPDCATPAFLSAIDAVLAHTRSRIVQGKTLSVVAIGSSSTLGVGASAPSMSYPSRLAQVLKERLPAADVEIVNRGIGGQDVGEENNPALTGHRPSARIW